MRFKVSDVPEFKSAYHACRPLNIENGIQAINKGQALRETLIRIKSDYVDEEKSLAGN